MQCSVKTQHQEKRETSKTLAATLASSCAFSVSALPSHAVSASFTPSLCPSRYLCSSHGFSCFPCWFPAHLQLPVEGHVSSLQPGCQDAALSSHVLSFSPVTFHAWDSFFNVCPH